MAAPDDENSVGTGYIAQVQYSTCKLTSAKALMSALVDVMRDKLVT